MEDSIDQKESRLPPWAGPWRLVAFWVAVGLFAGTAQYLASGTGPGKVGWLRAAYPPLLASAFWIPLSLVVLWMGRRRPPATLETGLRIHGRAIALHTLGSLAVGFVLNAGFFGVLLVAGVVHTADYPTLLVSTSLRFLHINAGAYWCIVLLPVVWPALASRNGKGEGARDAGQTLTVRSGTQSILVRVLDIRWIEGAGDYVRIHLGTTNHLCSERLKRLENRLDPDRFVRVHRSAIVNVSTVRKLRHLGHGDYEALLDDGSTVRVSRTRRSRLAQVLSRMDLGKEQESPPEPSRG